MAALGIMLFLHSTKIGRIFVIEFKIQFVMVIHKVIINCLSVVSVSSLVTFEHPSSNGSSVSCAIDSALVNSATAV